jgi:hypothetical protein
MMLKSDELTLPGTDLEEYHAYQAKIMSNRPKGLRGNTQEVLKLIEEAGIPIDGIDGLPPYLLRMTTQKSSRFR